MLQGKLALGRKLKRIKNIGTPSGQLTPKQDNAWANVARVYREFLLARNMDTINVSPYRPELWANKMRIRRRLQWFDLKMRNRKVFYSV